MQNVICTVRAYRGGIQVNNVESGHYEHTHNTYVHLREGTGKAIVSASTDTERSLPGSKMTASAAPNPPNSSSLPVLSEYIPSLLSPVHTLWQERERERCLVSWCLLVLVFKHNEGAAAVH